MLRNRNLLARRCPHPRSWFYSLTIFVSLTSFVASADTAQPGVFGEDLYFGELPIILSATRLSQPLAEAPLSVTVIDREMIDASGARELADVFRLVPGFLVGSFDGHQRTVGYHGLLDSFNRRMQVLIDGRSVYTPTFGGVLWSDLPLSLEDVDRIEVVRGPNAASYGPNSFMGIVSITTRHASDTPFTFFKMSVGDPDYASIFFRDGMNYGDIDFRISVQRERDSGFENIADSKVTDRVNIRADYQATARDNFSFNTGINTGERGEGEGTPTNPDRNINATSYFIQGRWRKTISPSEEFSLQLYHNSFLSEDRYFASLGALSGIVNFNREGRRTDLEFEHTLLPKNDLKVAWGFELRRDEGLSDNIFLGRNVSNDVYRLFGNMVWEFYPRWLINLGAMLENNDLTGTDTSPRLAINYRFNNHHSYRFTASRATRTPSFFEARVDFYHILDFGGVPVLEQSYLTQDDVSPEKIDSVEIGYVFDFPELNFHGDIKFFREKISGLISSYDIPLLFNHGLPVIGGESDSFHNLDNAVIDGIEFQVEWRPSFRDRIVFGGALLDIDSDDIDEPFSDTVPDNIFSLMWIHRTPGALSTAVSYLYSDDFLYLGDDHVEEIRRLDFRVAQKFGNKNSPSEIAFIFQNILGSYFDMNDSNVFDTRAYVSLAINF